jgi:hypothetical protein
MPVPLQRIDVDKLMAFLDELTNLSRKYQLVITGSPVTSDCRAGVETATFDRLQAGRYICDAEPEEGEGEEESNILFYFDEEADLVHLIDWSKL